MTDLREINSIIDRMRDNDDRTIRHALAHELRFAIVGNATPAPSDKIAAGQIAHIPDGDYTRDNGDVVTVSGGMVQQVRRVQLRALAGQGGTP